MTMKISLSWRNECQHMLELGEMQKVGSKENKLNPGVSAVMHRGYEGMRHAAYNDAKNALLK